MIRSTPVLIVVGMVGFHPALQGQGASLQGVVIEEGSGIPLSDVAVAVVEDSQVATTDANGQFLLQGLAPGSIGLRVSRDGYVTVVERLEISGGELGFVQLRLPALATALQELMVFGERTGGGASEANIGSDQGEHATAADLLESRIPGLNLRRGAGSAGGGANIQLRGVNSLFLSNEAVIYVDGLRISPLTGRSLDSRSSSELNALEMIPASSVARIRVLRGPAASTLYPDGSNGVIVVETVTGPSPAGNGR